MQIKQTTHFPTVSAFMHPLGNDDIRHPLIEVIHLDALADCSAFGNARYTMGFYSVVYKESHCGMVRYGRNEYDYDNGTLLFFAHDLAARQGVPSVRYFADTLHLSANYFGDLVKAQTGSSPQQIIQQYLITQARHRLITTTDTVSQIAYTLGFEYP